jgi:uncharacterized SAM-binding protein YcdF (DUF218 family)/glycosyltransferase involved in cell wall biosynthesis
VDILCISSIDWDFNWQGHQEIMSRLAAQGHRVLFVENTGVRAPKFADAGRWWRRLRNWRRGVKGFRQERPGIFIYSPLLLPFPHSWVARRVNRYVLSRSLGRWMRAIHFHRPLLWTFLPTRLVGDLIDEFDPSLVVYYCIADFTQLTTNGKIDRSERLLLDRADVVFVQGEELKQKCEPHRNISIFPFGVSLDAFHDDVTPAPELASLRRPLVGYVGGLHRHIDFSLLRHLATNLDGTMVLVGPRQADTPSLDGVPNIVMFGAQPHARVPEFLKGFDVGIIPYVLSGYTRTVYPTKLNEYLAVGLPVVSTDLPEVRAFSDRNGGIVDIATSAAEFTAAIGRAVAGSTPAIIERRIEVARQNSWQRRVEEMWQTIEAAQLAKPPDQERWKDELRKLYRSARRSAWQSTAIVAAIAFLLFYTPALWLFARPLYAAEAARPADAVVVFAGGVGESGQAGGGYQERVKRAVELYQSGLAPRMIFSSGYVFAFDEADIMKGLAVASGVPPHAVLLEKEAENTRENVLFVERLLQQNGWRTVLLVSSPYHMRRALLTWRRAAPDTVVIASPVANSQFYDHHWGASVAQVRGILHEYAAIAWYWWKDWI